MSKKNKKDKNLEQQRVERSKRYASYRTVRKEEEKPKHFKSTLLRLLDLLKPYRFAVAVVLLAAIIGTVVQLPSSDWMGDLIDAFNFQIREKLKTGNPMDFTECGKIILKVFALFGGYGICSFIQQYVMAVVTQKLICQIRGDLNSKLSRLPLKYFDKYTKGEILSKIINDCDNISSNLQSNITAILTSLVLCLGTAIYMFWLNWRLALVAIIIVPFSTIVTRVIARKSKVLFREFWDRIGELNGHIEEMYTGHNIVRIFNRKTQVVEEFNDIAESTAKSSYKANFISGLIHPILKIFNNINYIAICFIGALLVVESGNNPAVASGATIGTIVAFISYSSQFAGSINGVAKIVNAIQSTLASAERIFTVYDEEEEPVDTPKAVIESCEGNVAFEDVEFSYVEDKELIKDFSVDVPAGSLVAIVGPTGAGKTTIVNLLMRFYDIQSGSIKVDGVDIRDLSRENLRSMFRMVLQDIWLFKGTIRDIIAFGKQYATDEEVESAAKMAMFHDYVMELPDGYNTKLEEDGANISQGQRQLLTIARAIICNPKIMILDEATSSVDTRTEAKFQAALDSLMVGRTNFVIAHRLSTIKNADTILVMRRGHIVEMGNHEELLEADGFYASLYKSQYVGGIPPEDIE